MFNKSNKSSIKVSPIEIEKYAVLIVYDEGHSYIYATEDTFEGALQRLKSCMMSREGEEKVYLSKLRVIEATEYHFEPASIYKSQEFRP